MQHGRPAQHAHQRLNVHRRLGHAKGEHAEVAPSHGLEGQACAHVERGERHGGLLPRFGGLAYLGYPPSEIRRAYTASTMRSECTR